MMRASLNRLAGAAFLVSTLNGDPACAADVRPAVGTIPAPVIVVVKVASPWYAPNFVIRRRMRDTIPDYAALPGLMFKYFCLADDGAFGGIYLWHDATAAQAWFTPAWFAGVQRSRGSPANVRTFDVIRVLDTVPGGVQRRDQSDSVATLLTVTAPSLGALDADGPAPGLLRRYDLRSKTGVGRIDLWTDAAAANRYYDAGRLTRLRSSHGGAEIQVERFATPILLPSTLARSGPS